MITPNPENVSEVGLVGLQKNVRHSETYKSQLITVSEQLD